MTVDWVSWAPSIVSLVAAVFVAGQLSRTVTDHGKRLDHHDAKLEDHGTSITRIEAWKEGYNAGSTRH